MKRHLQPTGVLVSGGLDSAVLVCRLLRQGGRVLPLYMRCGLRWETAELSWLRRFLRAVCSPTLAPLQVVEVPLRSTYGAHWSLTGRRMPGGRSDDRAVYLPGRNVLLLAHAAVVCAQRGVCRIALGLLGGNPFGDASPRFIAGLARCLTQALGQPIQVVTPLRHTAKPALIRAPAGAPLALTFSCLQPQGLRQCGRCNKCAERRRAFRAAQLPDPTPYAA